MRSNGHSHFFGPNMAIKSDMEHPDLPFSIKIYRKAYLSILEEIKELVFSQDNDEHLQKYFYDETSNLKVKFDAIVARAKKYPSNHLDVARKLTSPAASGNHWPPKSVSSLEDVDSDDGLGIIYHPLPRPTLNKHNGDPRQLIVAPTSTLEKTFIKRTNTFSSTKYTQKSVQASSRGSPSLNKTPIINSRTKSNCTKSPLSSDLKKTIIPSAGLSKNTKNIAPFPNFAPSPDLLSSIIKSQSLSLGVPKSSLTDKKSTSDESKKISANNSLISNNKVTNSPETSKTDKEESGSSAPLQMNILSQDLSLSTDESDIELSNGPLKIDLDTVSEPEADSAPAGEQGSFAEIPPCASISETSSKSSKISCKKRRRKSYVNDLFSDTSDDDESSPKKLYIQVKSPSDHASNKSQFDISESSDEENPVLPLVTPNLTQTTDQEQRPNEANLVLTERLDLTSLAEQKISPTSTLSPQEQRHVMERPNFEFDSRPLAKRYHLEGKTFLEELNDAECNEINEKHESMNDSRYLVIDHRDVCQIKDLICSQLGRLIVPNQGKGVIPDIVELLGRDSDVKAESRNLIYEQIILEKIKDEKSVENSSLESQSVTFPQCKLVMLVLAMDKSGKFGNFLTNLMNLIYSSIFVRARSRTIKTPALTNLTKFYVTLCKIKDSVDWIGDFIVNMFQSEPTRIHSFLSTVIDVWPELLRDLKWDRRMDPLIQTILWLIFNKGNRGDESVKICREKLKAVCGVERYSATATDFVLTLVDWAKNYIGHDDVMTGLTGCFRMLTRYFDTQWLYTNVLNILLNTMKEFKELNEPAAKKEARLTWVIETVGTVGRNFPSSKRNMSLEFLEPIMDILRTKDPTPGPALETACLKSLVHLGQYLQMQVVNFLFEWHPVYQLEDACRKILVNYLKRARGFVFRKLIGVRRERLNAFLVENSPKKANR